MRIKIENCWPTDREIISLSAEFIKPFEGFSSKPYKCPADVWTIGYGTTRYPSGKSVCENDEEITKSDATSYMKNDLLNFLEAIREMIKSVPSINQISAMLSLSYNIGVGNFKKSSVLRYYNLGTLDKAADSFLLWNKVHGSISSGLVRRRRAERQLFLGEYK